MWGLLRKANAAQAADADAGRVWAAINYVYLSLWFVYNLIHNYRYICFQVHLKITDQGFISLA